MPESEFRRALRHYGMIREAAFRAAEADVRENGLPRHPVRFAPIDAGALEVWRATWVRSHALRYGDGDWEGLVGAVWRRPTAFHLAIWSGKQLCGLSVGRASKRRSCGRRHTLSLHFIEANPDPGHPLKGHVAELAIVCAEAYGAALGATILRLTNPLSGVLRLYVGLGFSVAGRSVSGLYLDRLIRQ